MALNLQFRPIDSYHEFIQSSTWSEIKENARAHHRRKAEQRKLLREKAERENRPPPPRDRSAYEHLYPTSVLDVLEMWVVAGDAIESCQTFENFLLVVIDVITEVTAGIDPDIRPFTDEEWDYWNLDTSNQVTGQWETATVHDVFNKTTWEYAKAGRAYARQRES